MSNQKQALLVGINYRGTGSALHGCINDVQNVKKMLLTKGYTEDCIVMLTDDTEIKPTKQNIITQLQKLCASDAEKLFFHYSGHGTQVPDRNHDEKDGKDEAICPLDYNRAGFIVDDQIRNILSRVPAGKKVLCVFDCCHSGTVCDLGYNIVKRKNQNIFARDNKYPDTAADIIMLSGCLDAQVSADAFLNGQGQGALTYAFLFAIQHANVQNYSQLYNKVLKVLKMCHFRQYPHLSSGKFISCAAPISVLN